MINMNKPLLAVDIDGVLYDFISATCSLLRQDGYVVSYDDITHWHALESIVGKAANAKLWEGDTRRELFRAGPAHLDSVAACRRMAQYVDLAIITHRPLDCADITMRWLADHHIHPRELHFAAGRDKGTIADCIGYIDDRGDNAIEIAETTGRRVWVPRRPWNGDLPEKMGAGGIRYFDSWGVVEDWVKREVEVHA